MTALDLLHRSLRLPRAGLGINCPICNISLAVSYTLHTTIVNCRTHGIAFTPSMRTQHHRLHLAPASPGVDRCQKFHSNRALRLMSADLSLRHSRKPAVLASTRLQCILFLTVHGRRALNDHVLGLVVPEPMQANQRHLSADPTVCDLEALGLQGPPLMITYDANRPRGTCLIQTRRTTEHFLTTTLRLHQLFQTRHPM